MNMGEFFDSLADYSFEDMQRKARMKEAEKAEANEPKWSHFGDADIVDYDGMMDENEGLADKLNDRGDKHAADVLAEYFNNGTYKSHKKGDDVFIASTDPDLETYLQVGPKDIEGLVAAASKRAKKPAEEKPKSYVDMSDEELDKSTEKLLEDIFEGKKPEGKTVEKTTVKVTGDDAKKVSEKAAADDVMPTEEFDKLIGKKPGEGSDEKLDDDVEAVMDMVYKLPPEKAKKIMERLSGLNLGNVPSDKNIKKEC